MAKKKQAAASSNGGATTRSRTKKSATVTAGTATGANKSPARAAARQNGVSNDVIGQTAGQVWQTLADNGSQTVTALKKSIDAPDELVLLALGWLAREDKVDFDSSGRATTVSLR